MSDDPYDSNCKRYQAPILLDRSLAGASCM